MHINNQCPRCGANLSSDQQFCHRCGTPVSQNQSVRNPNINTGDGIATPQWLANDAFATGPGGKSRGVAALLALLVGTLGIQYFYVGKISAGFICILLCLVTCGLWSILVFVQGILMFCMTNQDFEAKYVKSTSTFPLF